MVGIQKILMSLLTSRVRPSSYQAMPEQGGMSPEQAATVYRTGARQYAELPVPATHYTLSSARLRSIDINPSVGTSKSNAAVVNRHDRMNGYTATEGRQSYETNQPQMMNPVRSSEFQPWLIGPIINFVQNLCIYRAGYPAASVMNGGLHNLALSTRVDQLATRPTGGPTQSMMTTPQRRFAKVQRIPRYSTMPASYQTESAGS